MNDSPQTSMTAYLFDIDGVLTNPHNTDEVNPILIPLLVAKLEEGHPIGLISGRPLFWEIAEVVEKMELFVKDNPTLDPKILDNLFVSGEFGSTRAIHVDGKRLEIIDKERMIPKELLQKLEGITSQFREFAAFDPYKRTMFTVYSNGSVPLPLFKEKTKEIVPVIKEIVGNDPEIEIHQDRVSINVKHILATKQAATAQFLQWLSKKGIKPSHFYAFGDSVSDIDIGKELHAEQVPFTFIFVGEKEIVADEQLPFSVVFTEKHFDEGTIDYLQIDK